MREICKVSNENDIDGADIYHMRVLDESQANK